MRAVTATRKLQTAAPLGVKVTSGSSVRLPVMVTWVSGMLSPPRGSGVVLNGLVAVVVRSVAWSSFLVVGQQVPAGVGVPAWSATVLASCLLAWSGVVGRVVEQD